MRNIDLSLESTVKNESLCITLAAGLHILALIWNPILMKSDLHTVHDFVSVDVVESAGSPLLAEKPGKMSMLDTLKDMLLKPKTDDLSHVAPEVLSKPAAAPNQPLLKESTRRPMAMNFTPQSQQEDLAALKNPDLIKAPGPAVANAPVGGPTLQSKSFGGIRIKDVPFQVSGPETVSAGQASNIPIALGNSSAKSGLGYSGPTLTDASKRRPGIVPGLSGTGADQAVGSASPAQIAVGTGGSGSAPTGPTSGGGSLQDRTGSGSGGGRVGGALFGSGRGSGIGSGVEGIPSAAEELNKQMGSGSGSSKGAKHKGFEIAGPLTNRPISYKVIPEYPAWAEEQGIIGSVRLYFTVDAQGSVRTYIRVTKTTGYPALDQLGIDALKQWRFAALSSAEEGKGEWGIITFNFSLSSQ